jgi:hypothetical protein
VKFLPIASSPVLETVLRIQIRIGVKSRIRIRIKVKSRIRIRCKVKIQELWTVKAQHLAMEGRGRS